MTSPETTAKIALACNAGIRRATAVVALVGYEGAAKAPEAKGATYSNNALLAKVYENNYYGTINDLRARGAWYSPVSHGAAGAVRS